MAKTTGLFLRQYPLFSVVILHYKQPFYWREAVDSVLVQDYPSIQLVFSDDSTPGFRKAEVEKYIRKHKRKNIKEVIISSNIENLGTAGNCDNAVALCRGEYVLILDGDDILADKHILSDFANEFRNLPERENIVTANCMVCDINLQGGKLWYTPEKIAKYNTLSADQQFQSLYYDFFPVPSATAFRRKIYQQCGGYSVPHVRYSQDGYFFLHISRKGNKYNVLNKLACCHRAGGVCGPVEHSLSPAALAVKEEFLRIAEFEIFPYFDEIEMAQQKNICQRYYENLISYRQVSNDLTYGISEPAYTILRLWAEEREIPWFFPKSKLRFHREDEIWFPFSSQHSISVSKCEECCGCSACQTICSNNAISLKEDTQGFLYPFVDRKLCVECGLCRTVCPITASKTECFPAESYSAMKHKEDCIRADSRSGGFFAELAKKVLEKQGIVYGAAFMDDLSVAHIRIDQITDIKRLQGSKYVQSRLEDNFHKVVDDLEHGKLVLFSGTPCQTDGLSKLLKKMNIGNEKLILLDIVCHGVPSPKLYRDYIDYCERTIGASAIAFNFRDKEKGWRAHVESITVLKNGFPSKIFSDHYTDLFYQHNSLRPICYQCPYTCFERSSDLTVADYWGVEKYMPDFDDDKGVSLVIAHTLKGRRWIEEIKSSFVTKELVQSQCEQPALKSPAEYGKHYSSFWDDYQKRGMQYVITKYCVKKRTETKKTSLVHTVGILTFHRAHNYGAMLQAWALRTHLQKCGYQAEIIDYRCKEIENSYKFIPWQIIPVYNQFKTPDDPKRGVKMYLKVWKDIIPTLFIWWRRWANFNLFIIKQLHLWGKGLSYDKMEGINYDAVICGSDQIWATQDPAYYAAFKTNAKKIAYAPSMGNRVFSPEIHSTIYKWMHGFSDLSVREPSMIPYLEGAFGVTPKAVTLDPTLLLYGNDYDLLLPAVKRVKKAYIFCYCVVEDDNMVELAKTLATQKGYALYVLRSWKRKDVTEQIQDAYSGPQQFLAYIKNAEFVVTNSFHGTVFSILYHKLFYSVYEEGMNNRIEDLLNSLNLQERHIRNSLPDQEISIDWKAVEQLLDKMRETSFRFLDEALKAGGN